VLLGTVQPKQRQELRDEQENRFAFDGAGDCGRGPRALFHYIYVIFSFITYFYITAPDSCPICQRSDCVGGHQNAGVGGSAQGVPG
jgi:hypothetical protein